MAYLCGLITPEEKKDLEERGWEFEPPPIELVPEDKGPYEFVMVYVDNNLYEIMTGPDWEPSPVQRHNGKQPADPDGD